MGTKHLHFVWIVIVSGHVCGEVQFLQRDVGESVVIQCLMGDKRLSPYGAYLKRCGRRPGMVLFKHTRTETNVYHDDDNQRVHVIGDPSNWELNVTISQLRSTDTNRYCCEFVVAGSPDDKEIPGKVEYFLHVADASPSPPGDGPGSVDVAHVERYTGGSAELPCIGPAGEGQSAGEGVIVTLKRQKSSAPVEVLYRQYHHLSRDLSSAVLLSSSSLSPFPTERLRLSTAIGPRDMAFNLTLLQLEPQDSGFYSCVLHLAGRPDGSSGLGSRAFYVSVHERQCECFGYTTLLYTVFAAVAAILVLLIGIVVLYRVKARSPAKPQAQTPIYEEMVGVRPPKQGPCGLGTYHLEEMQENSAKKRHENHYESPNSIWNDPK